MRIGLVKMSPKVMKIAEAIIVAVIALPAAQAAAFSFFSPSLLEIIDALPIPKV